MTDNITDIIAGCIAEKRKSQEELYNILSPGMYAVCLQYASDADEACDFLQEGFIKVFENIKNYRNEGSFEGWVRRIMVNTALQILRKKKQMYVINTEIKENTHYDIPDVKFEREEEELIRMIQKLPVNQRMIFNLYAIEGFNHTEIAKMTGIPENTSKSHLHRARIALKGMVKNSYQKEARKIRKNG